jgi:hypothetical protein
VSGPKGAPPPVKGMGRWVGSLTVSGPKGAPPSGLRSEGARNERPSDEGRRRVKRPEASEREKQRPEASEQVNQRPEASEQETQLIWAARLAIADFRLAAWFWWMTPLLTALSSLT